MADDLSPARVAELLREGAQLVDVREPYERDAGRIPDDTAHIELDRLTDEAGSHRPRPDRCLLLPHGKQVARSPRRPSQPPATTPTTWTAA